VTIHLTAAGMRRAADVLDQLAKIEAETGVQFDGAYNGHAMVSITDSCHPDQTESLRLVRLPAEQVSPNVEVDAAYAFEFEVP
jgi:hypothetical protein